MSRAHNDANVLCLGARTVPEGEALAIADVWLAAPFDGGGVTRVGSTDQDRAAIETDEDHAGGVRQQKQQERNRPMATARTRMHQAHELGQSIWYDNMRRGLLRSGALAGLVDKGVRGLTSNPTIFERAIVASSDYEEALRKLAAEGKSTADIYEALVDRGHPRRLRSAAARLRSRATPSTGASRSRCCPSWRPTPRRPSPRGCASPTWSGAPTS